MFDRMAGIGNEKVKNCWPWRMSMAWRPDGKWGKCSIVCRRKICRCWLKGHCSLQNTLGGQIWPQILKSVTSITYLSLCILLIWASEAATRSKQPWRSNLTSDFEISDPNYLRIHVHIAYISTCNISSHLVTHDTFGHTKSQLATTGHTCHIWRHVFTPGHNWSHLSHLVTPVTHGHIWSADEAPLACENNIRAKDWKMKPTATILAFALHACKNVGNCFVRYLGQILDLCFLYILKCQACQDDP